MVIYFLCCYRLPCCLFDMQKILKLPFVFFTIAALLGLLLRWHFFRPISGLAYPYWLHAHSHIMFLGWVFNALLCGFIVTFIPLPKQGWYRGIVIILNLLVLGMLITFPLQGYGLYSIIISTLHTLFSVILLFRFNRETRLTNSEPIRFARMASLFFILSSVGPFAVGILAANGLGHTSWYHLAVYFYLHFQYNGAFTFGVFSLLFHWLEKKNISLNKKYVKVFRLILFVACFPAYALSTLWAEPGLLIFIAGFAAAAFQLVALLWLFKSIMSFMQTTWKKFDWTSRSLLAVALLSFILKLILQTLSAFPYFAQLAYEVRDYVMAYLHLVLIGTISFSILAWYQGNGYITIKPIVLVLFLLGFAGTEFALICTGIIPRHAITLIMVFSSFLLVLAIAFTTLTSLKKKLFSAEG